MSIATRRHFIFWIHLPAVERPSFWYTHALGCHEVSASRYYTLMIRLYHI